MKHKVVYRKFLIISFSVISFMANASAIDNGDFEFTESLNCSISTGVNDLPEDATSITVYVVVGTNATVAKSAYYSSSQNTLYIKEGKYMMRYTVHENGYYGQDSAKGKFKYRASDYYFDL